ncbi:LacI family DNA-binding transcriptional regulator [Nonomuraea rubra]|uniref:DNA-binding LacI/PurR family transcriptional regulator n=2 Tax=Nonomuraea rubra TaxID=46180 RepID=A0A7X0P2I3_9ACTN|nr:LacI family DNA-binding transcriptional regulator [Nonomuraea rubra]MBB6553987.1 DNA-binding LacI/PurR family transcriptional regulator [Nonomuraea rubra]
MQADEPVTILTVAREAGVSKTTASDALRGSGRVSERTRETVVAVAERLGYVPNGSARHLRKASTGTIGLHVPEVLTRSSYYMSFVFGVVEQAARHDYDVTLITSGQRRARPPRVDGLVLGDPLGGDPVVESLMATGLPAVSCERFPGARQADGVVWSEHAVMLARLLGHLRSAGAARPGLIVAGDESDWAASVHRGYQEWCAGQGIVPLVRRVSFDATGDEVRAAARALLGADGGDGAPGTAGDASSAGRALAAAGDASGTAGGGGPMDALVCAPAGAATEVAPLLREAGASVLLASCVDSAATRMADPPITAIDLRPREAGASCAELLFELLSGAAQPGTERVHPIELEIRASTTPRPEEAGARPGHAR